MRWRGLLTGLLLLCVSSTVVLGAMTKVPWALFEHPLAEALKKIGLTTAYLTVPRLEWSFSRRARLAAVDNAMANPLSMIGLSQALQQLPPGNSPSAYLARILSAYGLNVTPPRSEMFGAPRADEVWTELLKVSTKAGVQNRVPSEWRQDQPLYRALRLLLYEEAVAQQAYRQAGGNPTPDELRAVQDHLTAMISIKEPKTEEQRWLIPEAYHAIGARVDLAKLASALVRLQSAVERALPDLRKAALTLPRGSLDWDTPLGRVRVAGSGNDRHSGEFLLLIDLGGNDTYEDVGPARHLGNVSMVIDLAGDDTVRWSKRQGPGAGVLGISIWDDLGGNDRYIGGNVGLGAGVLGAGLLWDAGGKDTYQGGSLIQGVGEYGVGVLLDGGGNDRYQAALAGQGFGGPGGIGILADLNGDDVYSCGGVVPDQVAERNLRHGGVHYTSYCQGYGFGIRPLQVSGGIGLLLDRSGNDHYNADLFAQGGSYWFGLGMLVDRQGKDHYQCTEHCQGESLHAGAAILADWAGNDHYIAYEHAQGTGIDRAVGILFDHSGNDLYHSHRDSQGAGIKPFGMGILIDEAGNDRYEATLSSQGYAADPNGPEGFPADQWPVGILLDLHGADTYLQPGIAKPDREGRIQNRKGIAVHGLKVIDSSGLRN